MNQLETIIFDLGGILVPEKWDVILKGIAQEIDVNPIKLSELIDPLKPYATTGDLSLLQVYSKVAESLENGDPQQLLDTHMKLYEEHGTERDQRIIDLIERLKKDYDVVCLTNAEREVTDFNKSRGLFDYFNRAFISCDMGLGKPQRGIYFQVLIELGIEEAQRILFIDDKREYIDGAREIGMNAIKYQNHGQLMRDLRQFEVI